MNENTENANKKVYAVEIVETRVATIFVSAESEDEAFERAESLHETEDAVTTLLNDPCSNVDSHVNVVEEVTPNDTDKVW